MSVAYLGATTASDTTGDGTNYPVIMDQLLSNNLDAFDTYTGIYTVKQSGNYNICWNCRLTSAPSAATVWGIYIDISGLGKFYGPLSPGGGADLSANMSITLPLSQNQTIQFYVYEMGASKTASVSGRNVSFNFPTFASIYMIPSGVN